MKESSDNIEGPGFLIKSFTKQPTEDLMTAIKKYVSNISTCNLQDSKQGASETLHKYSNLDTFINLNISEGDNSKCAYASSSGYYFASSKLFPNRFLLLRGSVQSPDDIIYNPETQEELRIISTVNLF